jgi:hypothetical protein
MLDRSPFSLAHANYEGFEYASLPTTSDAMRKTLLNFAIVGGGRRYLPYSKICR